MATTLEQYQTGIVNADAMLTLALEEGREQDAIEIRSDIEAMVAAMKHEHPNYKPKPVADISTANINTQLDELTQLSDSGETQVTNDTFQNVIQPNNQVAQVDQVATQQDFNPEIVAQNDKGQYVVRLPNGKLNFVDENAGISTTDPQMVEAAMQMLGGGDGQSPAQLSTSRWNDEIIDQNENLARMNVMASGALFVGEGIDEAVREVGDTFGLDGDKARDNINNRIAAFKAERPKEYMAWKMGGAVLSTLPAMFLLPATMYTWLASLPIITAVAASSAISGTFQAAEGFVSGWLSSEEGRRGEVAIQRGIDQGIFGAAFGGIIPVAPKFLAYGWHRIRNGILKTPVNVIAETFEISKGAAKLLQTTIMQSGHDLVDVMKSLRKGGNQTMVADATEATKSLTDLLAASGNEAAEIVTGNILKRSEHAAATLERSLDKNIADLPLMPGTTAKEGIKVDARQVAKDLAKASAPARDKAYKAAYSTKINYSSDEGKAILDVLSRMPPDLKQRALKEANDILIMEGKELGQTGLIVGKDGLFEMVSNPNMMQLDTIKRALSEIAYGDAAVPVAGQGLKFVESGLSKQAKKLRYELNQALKAISKDYRKAVKLGQDKITRENAIDIGEASMQSNMSVAQLTRLLNDKNIGEVERKMVSIGFRASLDRILGNVRATANIGADIQAMKKLLGDFSSKNARKKLRLLIPNKKEYNAVVKELNKSEAALSLQNAVNLNSKTHVRGVLEDQVREQVEGGVVKHLIKVKPAIAARKFIDKIVKVTSIEAKERATIMKELAVVLTETKGTVARENFKILYTAFKNKAMNQRQLEELTAWFATRIGMKPTVAISTGFGENE